MDSRQWGTRHRNVFIKPLSSTSTFFLLFVTWGFPANAAPIINGVSDGYISDPTASIYGTNFTIKDPAAPILWDRLTNQEAYQGLEEGDDAPVRSDGCPTCPWYSVVPPSWGERPKYMTEGARTVGGAYYRSVSKGYFRHTDLGGGETDYIYVNWWFRTSMNFPDGGSNKFIRVWPDGSGDGARLSWTQMHLTCSNTSWGNWGGSANNWENLELEVNSADGTIKAWTTGNLRHNDTFVPSEQVDGGSLNNIFVFGLDASETWRTDGYEFSWTDIYVDTSPARVIVSNSATMEAGSRCEIQVPFFWSDDRIEVTMNLDSFSPSDELYLFVYDIFGTKNEVGFPLISSMEPELPGTPSIVIMELD